MNSIKMCRNFLHTGNLEVYHNVRLKLLPKRTSYSLQRMLMGSMLIAIEINSNLDTSETRRQFWSYSKSQKKYVRKSRVVKKNYEYRVDLLKDMLDFARNGPQPRLLEIETMLKDELYVKRRIPHNITGLEVPREVDTHDRSRF